MHIKSEPLLAIDPRLIAGSYRSELVPIAPRRESVALRFDEPWEGVFSGYPTVIHDEDVFRMYYRGRPNPDPEDFSKEVTCYAESKDGIFWQKPMLGLHEFDGSRRNNILLRSDPPFSHNFVPMLDTRSEIPKDERYKAVAGTRDTGLKLFVSEDGLRWIPRSVLAVAGDFDSQNVLVWMEADQEYALYFRTWRAGIRRVSRATSRDLEKWSEPEEMRFKYEAKPFLDEENLYLNQMRPYYRSPSLLVGTAVRFVPEARAVAPEAARTLHVYPGYDFRGASDIVLLASFGGRTAHRIFREAYIPPPEGDTYWISRGNFPALGHVQTGETELSMYVVEAWAQPSVHLQRYSVRRDCFGALRAGYEEGEFETPPLSFEGDALSINFFSAAAGWVKVELQHPDGEPVEGHTLSDSDPHVGNAADRIVTWGGKAALAGENVYKIRIRFREASVCSLQFVRNR